MAVIGKPNVGNPPSSTAFWGGAGHRLQRGGHNPDAIDSYYENEQGKFCFIDTAGMRKKSKVDDRIEKFSVLRSTMAIERSDVCLILIDAQEGSPSRTPRWPAWPTRRARPASSWSTSWDSIEKDGKTMDKMRQDVMRDLSHMTYAPIVFISALTGQRVGRLFELIRYGERPGRHAHHHRDASTTSWPTPPPGAASHGQGPPPEDLLYDPGGDQSPPLCLLLQRCTAVPLLPISAIWKIRSDPPSAWRVTPVRLTVRQKGEKEE